MARQALGDVHPGLEGAVRVGDEGTYVNGTGYRIDATVNAADLAILLGSWGSCPGCDADLNGDTVVDAADLAILLGNFEKARNFGQKKKVLEAFSEIQKEMEAVDQLLFF